MSTASYAAPVNDEQHERLRTLHDAALAAPDAEEAARAARDAVLVELARAGYGATAMARALTDPPGPWRPVTRGGVQRILDGARAAGAEIPPAPAGYRARGQRLDPAAAERLRAAHRALHDAGNAVLDALDARAAAFVELHAQGVSAREQAAALGVSSNTVQVPITAAARAARAAGQRRGRNRRHV